MPSGRRSDDSADDGPFKPTLFERLRNAVLKPPPPGADPPAVASPRGVEEVQAAVRSADDKERLVGLLAAPFAAVISILVTSALIDDDPPALLKNGEVNKLHVNPSLYHEVFWVLLGLSVLMLAMAWFRKRLFLGMVMALFGLAIFNLHYWGFGVPYIMVAAWLLVRSYRLQRELREVTATGSATGRSRPQASGRYTPPSSSRRRLAPPKPENPENEQRAG